jgi:hypothetical protein
VPLRSHLVVVRLAAALALVAACAGTSATPSPTPAPSGTGWASPIGSVPIVPILAAPELAKGPDRFLFTIVDKQNRGLADPSVAVHARFFDLAKDPNQPASESDAAFFWIIEGERGLYRAPVTFTSAGDWGVELDISRSGAAASAGASRSGGTAGASPTGSDALASPVAVRVTFPVAERPSVPAVGDPAPSVVSPTLADAGGDPKEISTDPDPDPKLYQLSIADALADKRPFLLVFATPAFCQTATCGPTLEVVRAVLEDFPALAAVHVEPYVMQMRNGNLQPVLDASGQFQTVKAVQVWNLPTEPYTFLVGADGKVAARFAGPIDPAELKAGISALVGG